MANNGRHRRRQTPESQFYDTLKGQRIRIVLDRDGADVEVRLIWVDRYSIGIRVNDRDILLNKRSIRFIERLPQQKANINGDDGGATL